MKLWTLLHREVVDTCISWQPMDKKHPNSITLFKTVIPNIRANPFKGLIAKAQLDNYLQWIYRK
jgi:hypothetical protein